MPSITSRLLPALVLFLCALTPGCAQFGIRHVEFREGVGPTDFRVPANFIVKTTGKTVFNREGLNVPVGALLKEKVEQRLRAVDGFHIGNDAVPTYVLGIEIRDFQPFSRDKSIFNRNEIRQPLMKTWVGLYTIREEAGNEQLIGEKLFLFPAHYGMGSTPPPTPKKKRYVTTKIDEWIDSLNDTIEAMETKDESARIIDFCADVTVGTIDNVFRYGDR